MAESAAFSVRGFKGNAARTTLVSGITSGATSLDVTDASTWAGITTPFRVTINEGESTEEEIEVGTLSSNTLSNVVRGVGGTSAAAHTAGESVKHTSSVRDFSEANYTASQTVGKITAAEQILASTAANTFSALTVAASRIVGRKSSGSIGALTAAEVKALLAITTADVTGLTTPPTTAVFYTTHTWTIPTPAVESGSTDLIIPMTVAKHANDVMEIERVEHKINGGTSVTWDLTKNGSNVTGFTSLSTTTTTTNTDPTNVTLADRDKVKPDISAVTGTPLAWEVTLTIKHTVGLT